MSDSKRNSDSPFDNQSEEEMVFTSTSESSETSQQSTDNIQTIDASVKSEDSESFDTSPEEESSVKSVIATEGTFDSSPGDDPSIKPTTEPLEKIPSVKSVIATEGTFDSSPGDDPSIKSVTKPVIVTEPVGSFDTSLVDEPSVKQATKSLEKEPSVKSVTEPVEVEPYDSLNKDTSVELGKTIVQPLAKISRLEDIQNEEKGNIPPVILLKGKKCPNGFRQPPKKDGTCKKKKKVIKLSKKQLKEINEGLKIKEPSLMDKSSCNELISDLNGIINKLTLEEKKYNEILRCISNKNRENISEDLNFLYPLLDDQNFNKKISLKKEFFDAKYIPKKPEEYENIEELANKLCEGKEFELSAHQKFVRNFLSSHTPYNSLLLFHGVGTGKTCSAISVCEEMRLYTKQLKNKKKIIVVATPNVQENFKLQLFNKDKLKEIDGYWNIKSCTGNGFIKEINPMFMKGLSKDKVIKQIKKIIRNSYLFIGYTAFANMIDNIMENVSIDDLEDEEKLKRGLKLIKKEFSNRMIVIDEVQNVRNIEGKGKKTTDFLIKALKYTTNTKLLLLSATPMYNSPREIIWLLKLMNCNDDRFVIEEKEVFDKDDNLLIVNGEEVGKEILIRNSTGYVSYVRGENPFAFPFRLYPNDFNSPHSIKKLQYDSGNTWYPKTEINGNTIIQPINVLDIFITKLGSYQQRAYNFIVNELKKKKIKKTSKGPQLAVLDSLTQLLNLSYPIIKDDNWNKSDMKELYGIKGLVNCFLFKQKDKYDFSYKRQILEKHGKIFSQEEVGKYSGKIKNICDCIKKSKGIIIIFSQFIYGGCVPVALILEEMGFKRNGQRSLFKEDYSKTIEPLNVLTMKPRGEGEFKQAQYAMITGDKKLSLNNNNEIRAATDEQNTNGELVKVIIISKAGSEGLDFRNIRQVHILEPWYNFNRTEQIIGRGVRNLSHCKLPFKERNVEIYLYGSELEDTEEEASDLYLYRLAEEKAKKIGVISRLLKQNAIDCKLNQSYNLIDSDKNIELLTSSNHKVQYKIKDKPYSGICDFMENCECDCIPDNTEISEDDVNKDTYNESFIVMNLDVIFNRIKQLFKEEYVYKENELISRINALKSYPIEQIYSALTQLIEDKNEFISDMLGRIGRLINIGDFYLFQPLEIEDHNISLFERKVPLDYKRRKISFKIPSDIKSDSIFIDSKEDKEPQNVEPQNVEPQNVEPRSEENKEDKQTQHFEESKTSIIDQKFKNILDKLYNDYNECVNYRESKKLVSATKNLWVNNCRWTIDRFTRHKKEIPITTLSNFALYHLLDVLDYEEKVILIENTNLKYIKKNEKKLPMLYKKYDESFFIQINKYFDDFLLIDNENDIFTIPLVKSEDVGKKVNKTIMFILLKDDGIEEYNKFPSIIIKELLNTRFMLSDEKKFRLKIKETQIGFITYDKRYKLQFKTKKTNTKNKGASCERGVTKSALVLKINDLLSIEKYTMDPNAIKRSSKIIKIYGKSGKDIIQILENGTEIPINTIQLCIEIEMIHRYYDKEDKSQRWNFNELEWFLNGESLK